jgi:hypothetical protein
VAGGWPVVPAPGADAGPESAGGRPVPGPRGRPPRHPACCRGAAPYSPAHPDHRRQLRTRRGHGPPLRRHGPRPRPRRPARRAARVAEEGAAHRPPRDPGDDGGARRRRSRGSGPGHPSTRRRARWARPRHRQRRHREGRLDWHRQGVGEPRDPAHQRPRLPRPVRGGDAALPRAGRRPPGADLLGRLRPRHARHPDRVRRQQGRAERAGRGHALGRVRLADQDLDDPARLHRDRHQRRPPRSPHRGPGQGRAGADRCHRARAGARLRARVAVAGCGRIAARPAAAGGPPPHRRLASGLRSTARSSSR